MISIISFSTDYFFMCYYKGATLAYVWVGALKVNILPVGSVYISLVYRVRHIGNNKLSTTAEFQNRTNISLCKNIFLFTTVQKKNYFYYTYIVINKILCAADFGCYGTKFYVQRNPLQ